MSEANQETPEPQQQPKPHGKPLLIIPEQIAHLKAKGVTFNLCSDLVHKYGKPSDMPARVLMELFPLQPLPLLREPLRRRRDA